jgi:heme-degrading monooxygenase HmoA
MFARVITAQAGPQGFDRFIGLAREQLSGASRQPRFKGFHVLTNAETGKVIIISLWETREQMPAGIQDQARPATGRRAADSSRQRRHVPAPAGASSSGAGRRDPADRPGPRRGRDPRNAAS